jgi:cbb3-type cytochrome oxidase maturation protein
VEVLYVILPVTLLIVSVFVVAFIRTVKRGDLDDLDSPPVRMLHDDED